MGVLCFWRHVRRAPARGQRLLPFQLPLDRRHVLRAGRCPLLQCDPTKDGALPRAVASPPPGVRWGMAACSSEAGSRGVGHSRRGVGAAPGRVARCPLISRRHHPRRRRLGTAETDREDGDAERTTLKKLTRRARSPCSYLGLCAHGHICQAPVQCCRATRREQKKSAPPRAAPRAGACDQTTAHGAGGVGGYPREGPH